MIFIRVRGHTFDIRKRLKDNKFRWREEQNEWTKTVAEASLNNTLEKLRPMKSWSDVPTPSITIVLSSVDINGGKIGHKIMGIKLLPKCLELEERNFYQEYQRSE